MIMTYEIFEIVANEDFTVLERIIEELVGIEYSDLAIGIYSQVIDRFEGELDMLNKIANNLLKYVSFVPFAKFVEDFRFDMLSEDLQELMLEIYDDVKTNERI